MRNKISRYEENQVDRFLYDLYLLWGGNLDEDMCIGEGWIVYLEGREKYQYDIGDDELINEVLQEREEAVRIALVYKAELDRIEISDKDIEHLHNTVSRVLEIIKAIQLAGTLGKPESEREKIEIQVQGYEQIKELISVDTLKSMQLLGFNYKAAIGEPLTQLCANAITGWGNKNNYHKKR